MPYIKQDHRELFETKLQALVDEVVALSRKESMSVLPGVMNYLTTSLIKRSYTQALEVETHPNKANLTYGDHNEIVGILECAKMEFYRRMTAPYEDKKIKENGDV